jgi:hypothetical protein
MNKKPNHTVNPLKSLKPDPSSRLEIPVPSSVMKSVMLQSETSVTDNESIDLLQENEPMNTETMVHDDVKLNNHSDLRNQIEKIHLSAFMLAFREKLNNNLATQLQNSERKPELFEEELTRCDNMALAVTKYYILRTEERNESFDEFILQMEGKL